MNWPKYVIVFRGLVARRICWSKLRSTHTLRTHSMSHAAKSSVRRYLYRGRQLSAYEIGSQYDRNPDSVYMKLRREGVKEGDDVTKLIDTMARPRTSSPAQKSMSTVPGGIGFCSYLALDTFKYSVRPEILSARDKFKTRKQALSYMLVREHGYTKSAGLKGAAQIIKLTKAFNDSGVLKGLAESDLDAERNLSYYVACLVAYPLFVEVSSYTIRLILGHGQALTSEVNEYLTQKYGPKNNVKDAMRAILDTLAEVDVLSKERIHRRNSVFELSSTLNIDSEADCLIEVSKLLSAQGIDDDQVSLLLVPFNSFGLYMDNNGELVPVQIPRGAYRALEKAAEIQCAPIGEIVAKLVDENLPTYPRG